MSYQANCRFRDRFANHIRKATSPRKPAMVKAPIRTKLALVSIAYSFSARAARARGPWKYSCTQG